MTSVGREKTDLSRRSGSVSTIVMREPGHNWTAGLRTVGGITIPFAGGLLHHGADIFLFLVLLWGLTRAGRDYTAAGRELPASVAVAKRAVTVIVGAFAGLAILSFGYALLYELVQTPRLKAPALAGPVGLAVAGAVILWPALCWRVGPARERQAGAGAGPGRGWGQLGVMATAALVYLRLLYYWPGLDLLAHWQVVPLAAGIVIGVYVLVGVVFGGRDTAPLPFAVSLGMLAAILGAAVAWPILVYSGFRFGGPVLYVNVIGKWAYLAVAAVTLAGLCLMAIRVIAALGRGRTGPPGPGRPAARTGRLVPWGASIAVAAVILLATVPALITQTEVADPQAHGLLPADLIFYAGLYRALPQLLSWLFLALAIGVLLTLPLAPGAEDGTGPYRSAARRLAIPVLALILFSSYAHLPWLFSAYTWLYIPVTPIVGVVLITRLVLPASLTKKHRTLSPADAIHRTMDAWRIAEFADSQRQKLLADDDDLRAALKQRGLPGYRRTFRSLAVAQNLLARRHDHWQRRAQSLIRQAFDHQGDLPDANTARWGAAAGAVLGIAPAAILLISTRPAPGWSGYPALDFFGYTAWILFIWPALGWAIGYFLPFIQGQNGVVKGLCVYAAAAASLPMNLMWLDGRGWAAALIYYLEVFAFLLVISVILCDLVALRSARMRPSAWTQVHNWRFLVTWSSAVVAAIGTATVTFLSTTATDLGHQTVTVFTGQSAPSSGIAGNSSGGSPPG
jgi:hypothetical protein